MSNIIEIDFTKKRKSNQEIAPSPDELGKVLKFVHKNSEHHIEPTSSQLAEDRLCQELLYEELASIKKRTVLEEGPWLSRFDKTRIKEICPNDIRIIMLEELTADLIKRHIVNSEIQKAMDLYIQLQENIVPEIQITKEEERRLSEKLKLQDPEYEEIYVSEQTKELESILRSTKIGILSEILKEEKTILDDVHAFLKKLLESTQMKNKYIALPISEFIHVIRTKLQKFLKTRHLTLIQTPYDS